MIEEKLGEMTMQLRCDICKNYNKNKHYCKRLRRHIDDVYDKLVMGGTLDESINGIIFRSQCSEIKQEEHYGEWE